MSCTGSCRVSSKANDAAWVVEEGYFNSTLSLADKGKSVWEPVCLPRLLGLPLGPPDSGTPGHDHPFPVLCTLVDFSPWQILGFVW